MGCREISQRIRFLTGAASVASEGTRAVKRGEVIISHFNKADCAFEIEAKKLKITSASVCFGGTTVLRRVLDSFVDLRKKS